MNETKLCKFCKTEIPKDAKICPNCRKKQKSPIKIVIAVIVVLLILSALSGKGKNSNNKDGVIDNSNEKSAVADISSSETKEVKKENATETDSEKQQSEETTSTSAEEEYIKVGGSFEKKGLKFTVTDAELDHQIDDEYGLYKLNDGLVYLMVSFTFENTGDGDKYVSIYDFNCYADNQECEQEYITSETGDFINTNLSSGRSTSFKTLYAVPADASSIELEYETNMWTDEKVIIKIK